MFSALAENVDNMNQKISAAVFLAPVASFGAGRDKDPELKFLCDHSMVMRKEMTIFEFGPTMSDKAKGKLMPKSMQEKMDANKESVAIKQVLHFAQLDWAGQFQRFDFGEEENQEKWGQPEPPVIPLGNITAPIGMYVGTKDTLATIPDNRHVKTLVKSIDPEFYEEIEGFNHVSF